MPPPADTGAPANARGGAALVVEMVSDLACPWCWLGLRRLMAARDALAELDVEILFRPYELDPQIPAEGVDYRTYMQARTNAAGQDQAARDRFVAMRTALEDYGKAEGVAFDFAGMTRRVNTFDAHRLVRWAQGQGKGAAAKEALFHAYFAEHRDISDAGVLSQIADTVGLDGEIVAGLLAKGADVRAVRDEQALFVKMGIRGVPTYVGNRSIAVQGAESAEKLADFLRTLAARQPAPRPISQARPDA
ncbi:MAG: DsbA family oxidoreductase [Pseudomonadota bacterium]